MNEELKLKVGKFPYKGKDSFAFVWNNGTTDVVFVRQERLLRKPIWRVVETDTNVHPEIAKHLDEAYAKIYPENVP